MDNNIQIRQGDVMVERIAAVPAEAKPVNDTNGRIVLAFGETTGHEHVIVDANVKLFREDSTGQLFLRVPEAGTKLEHLIGGVDTGDHGTHTLPAGDYAVENQRQFNPQEFREERVFD